MRSDFCVGQAVIRQTQASPKKHDFGDWKNTREKTAGTPRLTGKVALAPGNRTGTRPGAGGQDP